MDKAISGALMVLLWGMATFRSENIGNDTITYYHLFLQIRDYETISPFLFRYEIGYLCLNYLIGRLTGSFTLFLAVVNSFVYYSYYKFIDCFSENKVFSVFLFLSLGMWGQTVNIIRLQLALSIAVLTFIACQNKNIKLIIPMAILAFCFHRISIIYFLAFFVPKTGNKKYYIISGVLAIALIPFLPVLMGFAASHIPYFSTYLDSNNYIYGDVKIAVLIGILIRLVVIAYGAITYHYDKMSYSSAEKSSFYLNINMIYLSLIILILALGYNLFDRLGYFFWMFVIVFLPNQIKNMQIGSNKRLLYLGVFSLCTLYFVVINVYRPDWNHILPYEFGLL